MRLHAKLEEIHQKLLRNGCFPGLHWVPQNILADEKEKVLCGHSEKLAVACALINTREGEPIRITKNMQVCDECHSAISLIAEVEKRNIQLVDVNRIHIFEDGKCICDDNY